MINFHGLHLYETDLLEDGKLQMVETVSSHQVMMMMMIMMRTCGEKQEKESGIIFVK